MKTGLYFLSSIILLISFIFFVIFKQQPPKEALQYEYEHSWSNWIEHGLPQCHKPIVLSNAINIFDGNNCRDDPNDYCVSFIKQKLINFFGDRILETYPPHLRRTQHKVGAYKGAKYAKTRDYLTEDQYIGWTVHTLHQLGSLSEYIDFLQNNFSAITQQSLYLGSQFFMARALLSSHSGTPLHFAWGKNIFIQLSGRKRWMMIHPKHSYSLGCKMGGGGIYGYCSEHKAQYGYVDIDEQMYPLLTKHNISEDEYMDVILKPGDVLINCATWSHTIENLTPETVAHSLRFKGELKSILTHLFLSPTQRWILFDSLVAAIKWKMADWNKLTLFDMIYHTTFTKKNDIINTDKRYNLSGAINEKQRTD